MDGEWEMHFQVLLREKDGIEAKLRDAEVKIATLEEENASLRNASQAGNVLAATQGESYRSVAEGKVQQQVDIFACLDLKPYLASEAEPEISIIPGHDGEIVGNLVEAGVLTEGFDVADAIN